METLDCFDLHDLMLNKDDDIQDAYYKLYNFCMKSLEYSTKLKAKFKNGKLEKDDLIAKFDEANNLNENFKNQISSQVDKIKSLKEKLVESKTKVEKLTSVKLVVEPNSKENDFYIPPFKRNNEELKANIARIDKGKQSDVVSKPMSKTPKLNKNSEFVPICHHCHIVGHIRLCPKLRYLSTSKVRPSSRKSSSSKTAHVCHHYGVSRHTCPNCFKLYPQKQVFKRSQVFSQEPKPLFGELLKALSFLTQFQENFNSSISFSRHTRTRVFASSRPKTRAVWVRKEPKTQFSFLFVLYFNSFYLK